MNVCFHCGRGRKAWLHAVNHPAARRFALTHRFRGAPWVYVIPIVFWVVAFGGIFIWESTR